MGRSLMYRRRRRKGPQPVHVVVVLGALILVGLVGYWAIWGRGGSDGTQSPATGDVNQADTPTTLPVTEPLPEPRASTTPKPTGPGGTANAGQTGQSSGGTTRPTTTNPIDNGGRRGSLLDNAIDQSNNQSGHQTSPARATPPAEQKKPDAPRSRVQLAIDSSEALINRGDLLAARKTLNDALLASSDPLEQSVLRSRLSELNQDLVFGPQVLDGDPLVESYKVQSGDALSKIARKRDLATDWRLIQRVNRLSNANQIRVGQSLKLIRGPFHAVVHKGEYRLDLYSGPPDEPNRWVYIRSFRVGLGEANSTPLGEFVVRENGKLQDPGWVNPRDASERYAPKDPRNPIGKFWIGLEGVGDAAVYSGYGLHGTIDPASVGKQMSMGCVRLLDDDIELLFELLVDKISRVSIQK